MGYAEGMPCETMELFENSEFTFDDLGIGLPSGS